MDTNIIGFETSTLTVATNIFWPIYGGAVGTATTQSPNYNVMPVAGTFKNFYINCDAGPGAGITRTFTVYINGADTGITISLTGAGTGAGVSTGSDATHTVAFNVGDIVSLHTTATGTTTAAGTVRWTLGAACATGVSMVLASSRANTLNTLATNFVPISGFGLDTTLATNEQAPMPTAGTFRNAYFQTSSSLGVGASMVATLFQNGGATGITMTITGTVQTTQTDNTHTVTVAAGDTFYWSIVPAGGPAAATGILSMEFDPTVNGESVHLYASSVVDVATAVRFNAISSPNAVSYQSAESARQMLTQAAVWKKLYVNLLTAPVGTASFQTQLSVNAVAGNPSVTITGVNTTGNDTVNTVTATVGQTVIMKMTPTNTPATSTLGWGIVSFIQPPATGITFITYRPAWRG